MSPKPKVQCPRFAARGAWCVGPTGNTQHETRTASRLRAFTLIEIMIVVAIMGIVMSMSVPIVYKIWRKAPMRTAVKDIVEICSHARARAIMQGAITEVVIHPKENRVELAGASAPAPANAQGGPVPPSTPVASGSGLSAQLSNQIIIETLDVNMSGVEFNDYDQVRIRFYPNGVSDEMRMILFDGRDRMGIELEITTGLANVVPDPLREWSRR